MKRKLVIPILLSLALAVPAHAAGNASENSTNGSAALSIGVGSVLAGSAMLAVATGQAVVESVEKTADGIVMVLRGIGNGMSEAGKFSVRVGGDVSGAASVTVGQSVEVVTESTGHVIIASGKVIAFIPNEIGKSLMHHSPVGNVEKI